MKQGRCAPIVIAEDNMVRVPAGAVLRINIYLLAIRDVTSAD